MNITKFLNNVYFSRRLKEVENYAGHAGELQQKVLQRLVRMAADTEWGKKYDYASIRTYEDFRKRLPIQTYEEVKPYVERMRKGEQQLLWPTDITWFAKSSGTTNDKSKFLPVSRESLHDTHYKFMSMYKKSFTVFGIFLFAGIASLFVRGLSKGIDFTGGRNFVVVFEKNVEPETVAQTPLERKATAVHWTTDTIRS